MHFMVEVSYCASSYYELSDTTFCRDHPYYYNMQTSTHIQYSSTFQIREHVEAKLFYAQNR